MILFDFDDAGYINTVVSNAFYYWLYFKNQTFLQFAADFQYL